MSWTHEMYIGSMRPWPSLIRVLRTDGEMQEYEPKRGVCSADETERIWCRCKGGLHDRFLTVHVMECNECGRTYEHVNGSYEFCPHCGRRIMEVEQ